MIDRWKYNGTLKNMMVIKHLEINQISALNNPLGVNMPFN